MKVGQAQNKSVNLTVPLEGQSLGTVCRHSLFELTKLFFSSFSSKGDPNVSKDPNVNLTFQENLIYSGNNTAIEANKQPKLRLEYPNV